MPKDKDRHQRGGGKPQQPRLVVISKSLSRLLRHSAQQDRIPIDSHGYVRVDRVLSWQRLRSMQPRVEMGEVVGCVGESEKMRFGMRHAPKGVEREVRRREEVNGQGEKKEVRVGGQEGVTEDDVEVNGEAVVSEEAILSETQKAIDIFTSGTDTEPSNFYIRASQGHSMKGVEAENLLTPITLEDEASVPETVVHGTFYGAWESILRDGGLRGMGRNHVHFSSGLPLQEVLRSLEDAGGGIGGNGKGRLSKLMDESRVISGMRRDAQILIYIDVKKALREEEGMKWWRSDNGVILTEGIEGLVGMGYWTKAIEVKEGYGVLWERGEDGVGKVVKELPGHLKGRAMPMGKQRGRGNTGGGRGRGKLRAD